MKKVLAFLISAMLTTSALALDLPEETLDNSTVIRIPAERVGKAGDYGMMCAVVFSMLAKGADLSNEPADRDELARNATIALQTAMFYGNMLNIDAEGVVSLYEKMTPGVRERMLLLSNEDFTSVVEYCNHYVEISRTKMGITGERKQGE